MNIFETVRNNVKAIDVAIMVGFRPNRSKMICCPFHNDRHPSMKVDQRYYCFGCGAKGDAIDFVANYYRLNLKEAAERIAPEFVLSYDSTRYSNCFTKQETPKKSEYQIWMEQKRELFAQLSKLHEKLRQMKIEYAPMDREDSTWSPLFALTEKNSTMWIIYMITACLKLLMAN